MLIVIYGKHQLLSQKMASYTNGMNQQLLGKKLQHSLTEDLFPLARDIDDAVDESELQIY